MLYQFFNFDSKCFCTIDELFPQWDNKNENVMVLCPHDDDGLIGASYAILAALDSGAHVFVTNFCKGNAGYSTTTQKDSIENIRVNETEKAYNNIGISSEHIFRLNYSDFDVHSHIGWQSDNHGSFEKMIHLYRENRITRVLLPNPYYEHIDHTSVFTIGAYDAPQAGDPIVVDWGWPNTIISTAIYSVWADFSPENSVLSNRPLNIRANRAIIASKSVEDRVRSSLDEYQSQRVIINNLIANRRERQVGDSFIELYCLFDPRPKLKYDPYIEQIMELQNNVEKEDADHV